MNKRSILYSTVQVTIITFGIKALGLIKQSVLAAYCGANNETDAFFIASSTIVNLCTVIFSSISISLLTIHTNRLLEKGRAAANRLINAAIRYFLPLAIMLCLLFYIGAEVIAKFLAPSYIGIQSIMLAKYIRIMSISFVLWCYFLIVNVVLETDKSFIPGKFQGLFQNILIIVGAICLYKKYGIDVLLYAFLLSALLECVLVTWCARKKFKLIFTALDEKNEIYKLIRLSFPLIAGNAIYEINDIVDKQLSTGLGEGNASFLTYGSTINEIVTGVIVASVSTVLFSHFATWIAQKQLAKVENNLIKAIQNLTIIIVPVMVMCIVSGDKIVQILYGRGNFGQTEIRSTYGVVIGYAIGFIFQAARANIVKVYYAFQDTKTPMVNGIIAVGINVVLSVILSKLFGVVGISMATSIAMAIVTYLLIRKIHNYLPSFPVKTCCVECLKGIFAGMICACIIIMIQKYININIYMEFVLEGICCVLFYIILLYFLKSQCLKDVMRIGINKLKD